MKGASTVGRKQGPHLSRREREVMDIIYGLGSATSNEVQERLSERITNPAVRSVLRILEEKGHLKHRQDGPRYVYYPTVPRKTASKKALSHLLETFFDDSPAGVLAALIELKGSELSREDVRRMEEIIEKMDRKEDA